MYNTADRRPFVQLPSGFGVSSTDPTRTVKAVARGRRTAASPPPPSGQQPLCEGTRLRARSLTPSQLAGAAAIQLSAGCQNQTLVESFWGSGAEPVVQLGPQRADPVLDTWEFPPNLLVPGRVVYLVADTVPAPWQDGVNCSGSSNANQCSFFATSSLALTTFSTFQRVLAWVTRIADASPVEGASVTLYGKDGVAIVDAVMTDASGLATFVPPLAPPSSYPGASFSFLAVATHDGDVQLAQGSAQYSTNTSTQLVASVDILFARGL